MMATASGDLTVVAISLSPVLLKLTVFDINCFTVKCYQACAWKISQDNCIYWQRRVTCIPKWTVYIPCGPDASSTWQGKTIVNYGKTRYLSW